MNRYTRAESAELLKSGDHFFDHVAAAIDEAKEVIHFQTYIFAEDSTGKKIAEHLKLAAQRGVEVFLLLDGYGSKELSTSFITGLKLAGIQLRFFSTFFSAENISMARRMHHKIIVVDKKLTIIGGINIGNHYHGTAKTPAWLDFAVLIKGHCSAEVHQFCEMLFQKKRPQLLLKKHMGPILVRFSRSDWLQRKNQIYNSYKKQLSTSTKSITIAASYFLPGVFFLRRMKNAVKRGVKIRILVGGVSDIPLFHHAERYLYSYLLKNGIEIYEWNQSVMHGKLAIFDEKWSTIGSYNLNNLSRYKCMEMNADIDDEAFGKHVSLELQSILENKCEQVTMESWNKKTGFFTTIQFMFGYYLYKIIMYLIAPRE